MLISLLLAVCAFSHAQEHIVGRVVDAKTGEPLPFASIYVNGENSTISNADGEFCVDIESTDSLRFTYVGYKTLCLDAPKVGATVGMQADDHTLSEVTVMGTQLIVKNTRKRMSKEYRKHKKDECNFFYRQTSYCDGQCNSFLESFFSGQSAVQIRKLSLVTGRYVSLASSLTANPLNFYTFAQVPVYNKWKPTIVEQLVPLCDDYESRYKTTSQVVSDGERTVFRIDFHPRNTNRWAVKGSLYVDASTFELLKFEGKGQRDIVKHKVRGLTKVLLPDYSFVVNYTHDHGFTEVESVYFKTHFDFINRSFDTSGIMYNVGERYIKGRDKMEFGDNLPQTIRDHGIDRDFWRDNEVVKRTPIEESALELFEHDNLIGVF